MITCHDLILGSGLAGSLWALRLKQLWPQRKILVVDACPKVCDEHIWCCFESDVPESLKSWFQPYVSHQWPAYKVQFSEKTQVYQSPYWAIRERDLRQKLSLEVEVLYEDSVVVRDSGVFLNSGQAIAFERVFDARGWSQSRVDQRGQNSAFQKFVGIEFEFDQPTSVTEPLVMDATVDQIDGYRFFYVLPWSDQRLLVEETFFSLESGLDFEEAKTRICDYVHQNFGSQYKIVRSEHGCLPLVWQRPQVSESESVLNDKNETVALIKIGAAAGWFHPVTGYTLPILLQALHHCLSNAQGAESALCSQFRVQAQSRFYYWLNRMLYFATQPERYREVFSHFYRQPLKRIERFYSGRLSRWDQLQILRSPPRAVPIGRAVSALRSLKH